MHRKGLYRAVPIPLSLGFVVIWLGYLSTNYRTVETLLLSLLENKLSTVVIILLTSLLLCLIPFYLFQLSTGVVRKKDKKKLLAFINEKTESEYEANLHNVLCKEFDKIISTEAARGARLPSGIMARNIATLYVNDVFTLSAIIDSSIKEATRSTGVKFITNDLLDFVHKKLKTHNNRTKANYDNAIKIYYKNITSNHAEAMKKSFAMQIDSATSSRIRSLESSVNIESIA